MNWYVLASSDGGGGGGGGEEEVVDIPTLEELHPRCDEAR
jgi:hypothetical protein